MQEDSIIQDMMSQKEDSIMNKKEFESSYSVEEIFQIFDSIEDTNNFYGKHIYKNQNLTNSIYSLVNCEITFNDIRYTLGEYILLKIIEWGRSSYGDRNSKLFLFHVVNQMETLSIDVLLDDFNKGENGYFDSSLEATRNNIEKIKVQSDIISIGILIKNIDMTECYKEYKHVVAFHPEYLYSDRSVILLYNDFDKELLTLSLKKYFEENVICNFRLGEYKSYLAYLSLIKYYIVCENSISSLYSSFINFVYNFA